MAVNFPVFKTKAEGSNQKFNFSDPVERKKYFELKAGEEIEKLKIFLEKNTFIGFLVGPKSSGKGTYSKLFAEAVGEDKISNISLGDVVREVNEVLLDENKKNELLNFIKNNYRGFTPLSELEQIVLSRDTKRLLPTDLALVLLKWEIGRREKKAIFIDGFPRGLDQVSYSIFFRDLIGYRDDPDFFIFIDVPDAIIDERMKNRVICPICHAPRSPKLFPTKEIGYEETSKQFYLMCDNPDCNKAKMVPKEGDSLGIEAIRDRITNDRKVMEELLKLEGVPKIYLRNSVPVNEAQNFVDEYEITPEYQYEKNESGEIKLSEKPWVLKDNNGNDSYSLMPHPVAVSMIKQVAKALNL